MDVARVSAVGGGEGDARSTEAPVRRALAVAAAMAAAVVLLAFCWRPAFRLAGSLLVEEDALAPAEVMVVSNASPVGAALEAAALYRESYAREILLPGVMPERHVDDLHRLGIPYLPRTELLREALERSGVPADVIRVLPNRVDGTETETAATAAFAAERRPRSLLVVTARTHTARAAWLLRRALPGIAVIVRSPRDDDFDPQIWWHDREQAREVMAEYLRWINALLGDLWR